MKAVRWIICPVGRAAAPPGGDVYGLILWDDSPILIVGSSADSVKRHAVRIFAVAVDATAGLVDDDPDFVRRHPLPDPDDPADDIDGWLDVLRRATADPWFAVLDDEVVIAG
jgi:hypothetical protein